MSVKYSKDHEWVKVEGTTATVGISDYAQSALGDVVFVDLPEVGRSLQRGAEAAVVESVKAASEVYAPISGTVTAVNEALVDKPDLVNAASEGDGWFFKLEIENDGELADLMDEAAYRQFVANLE
ncbi:MAG: glycine cleavage system protein GcvH [Alphaproteobacteria bacterium]|nr:MAG: glycine cleavage system protein GcvH [Alphaproteobacteria bacterium]